MNRKKQRALGVRWLLMQHGYTEADFHKTGEAWVTICPFHRERTGSFRIRVVRRDECPNSPRNDMGQLLRPTGVRDLPSHSFPTTYEVGHCFGCQASGDAAELAPRLAGHPRMSPAEVRAMWAEKDKRAAEWWAEYRRNNPPNDPEEVPF